MMVYRTILATLAFLCVTIAASAQTLIFPALTGRVVDEAGLLGAPDQAVLTDALSGLEAKTTDQLVVVTLKSLQGTTIDDYGYQLGRAWGIGQKGKNNGALLIVAPNERKVRIEVGYGLEGTLTDALTKVIIENSILPRFKAGDFPGGIKQGTADIIQELGGDATGLQGAAEQNVAQDSDQATAAPPVWPLIVVAVAAGGFVILCAITGGGRLCRGIVQFIFLMLLFGGRGSSRGNSGGNSTFSGGGGSFGGGGSSGGW